MKTVCKNLNCDYKSIQEVYPVFSKQYKYKSYLVVLCFSLGKETKKTMIIITIITTSLCTVFHTDFNCPDKPVLTPSRLVLKYGDPASAKCVACQKACLPLSESVINMEASVGITAKSGTTLIWTVNRTTQWNLTPKCFYTDNNDKQCCSDLTVTVYRM